MPPVAYRVTSDGNYSAVIGATAPYHCILVSLKAGEVPLLIIRIGASYADDAHDVESLTGRVMVFKEKMQGADTLLDPAGIDTGAANTKLALAFDQFKRVKRFEDFLLPGEKLEIPPGQTWEVMLTSAYSQGDAFATPSDKRAKLIVRTAEVDGDTGRLRGY